jgi:two-component system, OmpR family, sensor histidine kinase MprB
MSFRMKVTLAAAGAVAVAVVVGSLITYAVVRNELLGQFDDGLRRDAASLRIGIGGGPAGCRLFSPPEQFGRGPGGAVQLVQPDGTTCVPEESSIKLPVSERDLRLAAGDETRTFVRDAEVSDERARILTEPAVDRLGRVIGALQFARPRSDVDDTLSKIRLYLFLVALGGVAVASALGLLVARTAIKPVGRLTAAAEDVTETRDLSSRIDLDGHGRDELGRLATSFNSMLAALEESSRAQQQLVADASHELRTPLTSLRTNIEVLALDRSMPDDEREKLLHDVVEQLGEMTALIAELVELARGAQQPVEAEDVRLDLVTAEAIERARRNRPHVVFREHLEESLVHGVPSTIERAVSNLLDNAGKWSPPGAEVEVTVRNGEVIVRDRGPGIDDDDLPYVFDRFYRAPAARGLPGSGLGLSIVRQVAEAHGGEVVAERAEGGGTRMTLRLGAAAGS